MVRDPHLLHLVWKTCNANGQACVSLTRQTARTHVITASDVGHRLRVVVRASNAFGASTARSAVTVVVTASAPTAPVGGTKPAVSGTVQAGQTLTTSNGTWTGTTPMTYAYKWQRCDSAGAACTAITGAAARTYMIAGGDVGRTLRSQVVASNGAGSGTATSNQTVTAQPAPTPVPSSGLHVSGNRLLNAAGTAVQLHGVNKSGPEYACVQGWGVWDGPSDDASVVAMRSWNSNIVRIPLNEQCWLGINGSPAAYSGANYRKAIKDFVALLHAHGMAAELSLMWAAPGTKQATYQPEAPNADHSPAMWASMAAEYKDDPNVILAPWGEPTVDANCLLNGGCQASFNGASYTTAGMQQAVNVMRQAGYNGVIAIPGIDYANNMTQWLSHKPSDPLGQLIAEAHLYGENTCDTVACLDREYAPVAAQVPLILGETGETYDDSSTGTTHTAAFLNWADAHDVGYETWTWTVWATIGSLISNDDGTPNGNYGNYVKSHFLTRP
jgi:endoglucanase